MTHLSPALYITCPSDFPLFEDPKTKRSSTKKNTHAYICVTDKIWIFGLKWRSPSWRAAYWDRNNNAVLV